MQVAFGGPTQWQKCKEKLNFQHVLFRMRTSSKLSDEVHWNTSTWQGYP